MIISHTFEAGTSLKDKRVYLYNLAYKHLRIEDDVFNQARLLFISLINLRLKGAKCSIEFTEEYKNIKNS